MSRESELPSESELTPFQQVWNYISNTPENINPAILKQIIEKAYHMNKVAAPDVAAPNISSDEEPETEHP